MKQKKIKTDKIEKVVLRDKMETNLVKLDYTKNLVLSEESFSSYDENEYPDQLIDPMYVFRDISCERCFRDEHSDGLYCFGFSQIDKHMKDPYYKFAYYKTDSSKIDLNYTRLCWNCLQ